MRKETDAAAAIVEEEKKEEQKKKDGPPATPDPAFIQIEGKPIVPNTFNDANGCVHTYDYSSPGSKFECKGKMKEQEQSPHKPKSADKKDTAI